VGKIFISSILWVICFSLNVQAYSINSYYGIWLSLIVSLIIIIFYFKKFVTVFRFKPNKENYDFSVMEYIIRNGTNIVGVIIFILGVFYQTIDLSLRSSSLFDKVKREIFEEKSDDVIKFGMLTINHFKYKNGDVTYQLNVPAYSSELKELIIYDVSNLKGEWEFKRSNELL
jgi:hypothetical protein